MGCPNEASTVLRVVLGRLSGQGRGALFLGNKSSQFKKRSPNSRAMEVDH